MDGSPCGPAAGTADSHGKQDVFIAKPQGSNERIQNKDKKQTKRLERLIRNQRKGRDLPSCGKKRYY